MSTTLRVFVGEDWPEMPATRWVLLDEAGALLQQGESDALRWPVSDYCEAVISVPEVSWIRGTVPARVSSRDLSQAVAGVLEDQLADDPDRCHLTVCGRQADSVDVLVISRTRLRNVIAQFAALNRRLSAAYSELQCCPEDVQSTGVFLAGGATVVVRHGRVPLVLEAVQAGAPSELLSSLLSETDRAAIALHAEAGIQVDLGRWRSELNNQNIAIGAAHAWYKLPGTASNLLHGEFASSVRRSNLWNIVRPAVLVATVALTGYLIVGLAQLSWMKYRIGTMEARVAELFQGAFPGVPPVAPIAQARRQLDQLRTKFGLTTSDDPVVLLAKISEALGPAGENAIKQVKYADHRLQVTFVSAGTDRFGGLRDTLARDGYHSTLQNGPGGTSLVVEWDMSR